MRLCAYDGGILVLQAGAFVIAWTILPDTNIDYGRHELQELKTCVFPTCTALCTLWITPRPAGCTPLEFC